MEGVNSFKPFKNYYPLTTPLNNRDWYSNIAASSINFKPLQTFTLHFQLCRTRLSGSDSFLDNELHSKSLSTSARLPVFPVQLAVQADCGRRRFYKQFSHLRGTLSTEENNLSNNLIFTLILLWQTQPVLQLELTNLHCPQGALDKQLLHQRAQRWRTRSWFVVRQHRFPMYPNRPRSPRNLF